MIAVFDSYKELFEKRYANMDALSLGEDSVRYDFFLALMREKQLQSWQIHLEHPIHQEAFIRTENKKRKRNEKPQLDLLIDEETIKMSAEFAFFRRNSNPDGDIAKTENTFKMLNDFIRLGIHSYLTASESYFVCVSDSKMFGYELGNGTLPAFPGNRYQFNYHKMVDIMEDYKSADKVLPKFLNRLYQLELTIVADKVYDKTIISSVNKLETKILIYQIAFAQN